MRKFIFNGQILGAIVGAGSLIQQSRKEEERDWRTVLLWISWLLSLIVAIGTVVIESQQAEISEKSR